MVTGYVWSEQSELEITRRIYDKSGGRDGVDWLQVRKGMKVKEVHESQRGGGNGG